MLLALAINVAGNWLLIPVYGYKATAYLTVVSSTVYLFLVFALTRKQKLRPDLADRQILAELPVRPAVEST